MTDEQIREAAHSPNHQQRWHSIRGIAMLGDLPCELAGIRNVRPIRWQGRISGIGFEPGNPTARYEHPPPLSMMRDSRDRLRPASKEYKLMLRHSLCLALWMTASPLFAAPDGGPDGSRPNVVMFFVDNLGYGDIGPYGSTIHRTPHLDRMADEGLKLTHFYVTAGVCTPSRSSLMTGCYPRRVNMHVSDTGGGVLQPVSPKGLHPDEITIAEVLKEQGYATTIIGKWHLGDQLEFFPTRQGFDSYLGVPYSDDMVHTHRVAADRGWPPLPLMKDEEVYISGVDRDFLTQFETKRAIEFIEENREKPFFVYLPQAMPGSTQAPFASPAFKGKSNNGAWGDSVEELDWSAGEILAAIQRLGLDEKTLVIWMSDNGAPRRNPPQGSNAPLKGWGYDTSEGAMRVPCLVRWPGKVAAGTVNEELCTTLDWLPTLAKLAGGEAPRDRIIDGHDIRPILYGDSDAKSPYEAFYYYQRGQLQAVRSGPWKLYLPLGEKSIGRRGPSVESPELYHLYEDVAEEENVAGQHSDVVSRLRGFAEQARADLGDEDREGAGQRRAGWVENPTPRLPE